MMSSLIFEHSDKDNKAFGSAYTAVQGGDR